MILAAVMDEVAAAMASLTDLTVYAYPVGSLSAPAGYVSYPRLINYDAAYAEGCDEFTDLPIVLVAGKANDLAARDAVSQWTRRGGDGTLIGALKAYPWVSCDNLDITSAEFDLEIIGGVPYLAAMFKATVLGPGED